MEDSNITIITQRHQRNLTDQNFKLRAKFLIDDEIYFSGSVYDISVYGLCVMITNITHKPKELMFGKLFLERLSYNIQIDSTIKWIDYKSNTLVFAGFETKNLLLTDLRAFINK